MKNKIFKTFVSRFLVLVFILSIPGLSAIAHAVGDDATPFGNWNTTHVSEPGLITSVSCKSNATISFRLTVPAGCTASYAVELIPNNRTGSLDTVSGSWTNTQSVTATKLFSVPVNYFSDQYFVSASYETGTQHEKVIHEDTEGAVSKFLTRVVCDKFVWTEERIAEFERKNSLTFAVLFAGTIIAEMSVSKKSAAAVGLAVGTKVVDGSTGIATTSYSPVRIVSEPILPDWSYVLEYAPAGDGGYTRSVHIYNHRDEWQYTESLPGFSPSVISYAIH